MKTMAINPLSSIPPDEPEKRRKIIRAARELFAQKRYDDITVPEIVKAAGVAQGTFYRYFESKTMLVGAISGDVQRDVTTAIRSVVTQEKPISELLEPLIRTVLETLSTYEDVLPFLNTDALLFGDSREADQQREPYLNLISQLIERDQKKGVVSKKLNAQLTARLVDGLVGRVVRDCLLHSDNLPVKTYISETVSFLQRALRA